MTTRANRLVLDLPRTKLEGRRSPRTHGLRATYVDGCRCDPCTDAEAAYWHVRKARRR